MAELHPPDPELEDLYASDREIPPADAAMAGRILARVHGAAAAAGAAGASGAITVKAGVAIALACFAVGAGTGAVITSWASGPSASVAPVQVAPVQAAPVQAAPVQAAPAQVAPVQVAPVDAPSAPVEPAAERGSDDGDLGDLDEAAPRGARAPSQPSVAPAAPTSRLAEERRLLEAARAALARGRPDDADEQLDRHAGRFTDGELREERESLGVEVAFAAHRWDVVVRRAEAFLAASPSSVHRGRVQRLAREARERSQEIAPRRDGDGALPTSEGGRDHVP